jgi:hypothetical protein
MKKLILSLVVLTCISASAGPAVTLYKDYRYHTRPYGGIPNSAMPPGPTKMYQVPQTGFDAIPPVYELPKEPPPAGFNYGQVFDEQCKCYKVILVPY